jgi:hypothetical protein
MFDITDIVSDYQPEKVFRDITKIFSICQYQSS